MTHVGTFVSNTWGNFVSRSQPVVAEWYTRVRPTITEWCTKGANFVNSLDTDGKARSAFCKTVRDPLLVQAAATNNLYSRVSQYAVKDHPLKFWLVVAGLTGFISLFYRPLAAKTQQI